MSHLKIAVSSWDIRADHQNYSEVAKDYLQHLKNLLEKAQVILLPEYAPCALLNDSVKDTEKHSHFIWKLLAPEIKKISKKHDALIVAGSAPFKEKKHILNRAIIYASGKELKASKIALTPWEKDFKAGKKILCFKWKQLRIAVVICLDVEMPEISAKLKKEKIDLLLVPSATSDHLGSERVQRCASARAVELGAIVAVSPLLGFNPKHPLVDVNVGRIECYYPSQDLFASECTHKSSELLTEGIHAHFYDIDSKLIKDLKKKDKTLETKPFLVKLSL